MGKRPSFQFYPGDWRRDAGVMSLSFAAKGLWIDMLILMFDCDRKGYLEVGGKPVTVEQLARMTSGDVQEVARLLYELEAAGVFSRTPEHGIYCRRMVRDEYIHDVRSAAGKLGAPFGSRGGRPRKTAKTANVTAKEGQNDTAKTANVTAKEGQNDNAEDVSLEDLLSDDKTAKSGSNTSFSRQEKRQKGQKNPPSSSSSSEEEGERGEVVSSSTSSSDGGRNSPIPPSCSEPEAGSRADVILTFPTVGKGAKEWHLYQSHLDEWQQAFPDLDILGECHRALAWVRANQRKTAQGMPRFLVGWLGKAQNGGARRKADRNGKYNQQAMLDTFFDENGDPL